MTGLLSTAEILSPKIFSSKSWIFCQQPQSIRSMRSTQNSPRNLMPISNSVPHQEYKKCTWKSKKKPKLKWKLTRTLKLTRRDRENVAAGLVQSSERQNMIEPYFSSSTTEIRLARYMEEITEVDRLSHAHECLIKQTSREK